MSLRTRERMDIMASGPYSGEYLLSEEPARCSNQDIAQFLHASTLARYQLQTPTCFSGHC